MRTNRLFVSWIKAPTSAEEPGCWGFREDLGWPRGLRGGLFVISGYVVCMQLAFFVRSTGAASCCRGWV